MALGHWTHAVPYTINEGKRIVRRLEGKVALVTGASRGIGAAVAERFADEGAAVALGHYPSDDMGSLAETVARRILGRGGSAITVGADVTDEAAVTSMVQDVTTSLGDLDVLVTNAGGGERQAWHEITAETWDRVLAVNLRSTFLCAKAVYDGMRRKEGGAIVTVSSVMAHLGMPGSLPYVAAKAGIIGLTRGLAHEVGADGIRVNCVMPGAIRTEQEEEAFPDQEAELLAKMVEVQCLPRRGYAQDLAGTFVYLASDDSAFVTGQVVAVDGGWVHR